MSSFVSNAGRSVKTWFYSLGPGLITAALVFGPSKMTITSKLGAEYGYSLLWIIVMAIFFMAVFTNMASRIGIATNQSLLTTIRQRWGNKVAAGIGGGIFLVTSSFQAGNAIGVGIAMAEITHTTSVKWIVIFNLTGIVLLFFRKFYKILEKIMIALIGLMLISFIITLAAIKPVAVHVLPGFIPVLPAGSSGLVIAFIASCFSIVGAFYQSYLVQERLRSGRQSKDPVDTGVTGIIILGIMSAIVLICAAAVLHPAGIKISTASDMGRALEPIFGAYASLFFLLGLFGASFSSLIGNASVGGTLLGDALGYGSHLSARPVRILIALVMVIGSAIAILFGSVPLELIVLAQSVTILIVPFIGIAMYSIANNKIIMGGLANKTAARLAGGIGLTIIIILALKNIQELFFK